MILLAAENIELEMRQRQIREMGVPFLRSMYLRNDQDSRKINVAESRPKL